MIKQFMSFGVGVMIAGSAMAEQNYLSDMFSEARYYTEYKNDWVWNDGHYQDNSTRNNIRLGVQFPIFYAEAGPVESDGEFGTSYEVGYKYNFNEAIQLKGKFEGYQFDSFEGPVVSKFETEVRYYFN
jgi:hypothetical protein